MGKQLIHAAAERKVHLIIEGTFCSPAVPEKTDKAVDVIKHVYSKGLSPEQAEAAIKTWEKIRITRQKREAPVEEMNVINQALHKLNPRYLIPTRISASLDPSHLSEQVKNASEVVACREEVEHLSRLVYGRSNVFENELSALDRVLGDWERVKRQIETDPTSIAPLAGKEKLLGKDQARKDAQAHLSRLDQAIENYADASRQAH